MKPRRFAVVGDPIAHSKSPTMHGAAFLALNLPHTYEAIRASADELPHVVTRLREGAYHGINITVPHKERVLDLVDAKDESAAVAGAANTLVRDGDGRIVAHNTDAPALAAELRRVSGGDVSPSACALILGSGGAARAAIVAVARYLGVRDIVVRARGFADPERERAFRQSSPYPIATETWFPRADTEQRTGLLVQATSAGMRGAAPGDDAAAAVDWSALPNDAIAIDVVYAPRDTPWLRAARTRGLRADDGLGMLARQGGLAFELWLGVAAPFDVMRQALE
jgi:shikimate dehydrogenase